MAIQRAGQEPQRRVGESRAMAPPARTVRSEVDALAPASAPRSGVRLEPAGPPKAVVPEGGIDPRTGIRLAELHRFLNGEKDAQGKEVRPAWRPFAGKGRPIESFELLHPLELQLASPRASGERLVVSALNVRYADGGSPELYNVALKVGATGQLSDAFDEEAFGRAVADWMHRGSRIELPDGASLQGELTPAGQAAAEERRSAESESSEYRKLKVGSSNTLVFVDGEVLKWITRLSPGTNKEVEDNPHLVEFGFTKLPRLQGTLSLSTPQGEFLAGALHRWRPMQDALEVFATRARAMLRSGPAEREAQMAELREQARVLGELTGEMDATLGNRQGIPSILARDLAPEDLIHLVELAHRDLDRVMARFGDKVPGLRALEPGLRAKIDAARSARVENVAFQRIHGDYHLGQVGLTAEGWIAMDFEGEPNRPVEERRQRSIALRDVAGMLRSFDYLDGDLGTSLSPMLREAFLRGYRATTEGKRINPERPEDFQKLLDLMETQKTIYELEYEAGSRPELVRIPLARLNALAKAS